MAIHKGTQDKGTGGNPTIEAFSETETLDVVKNDPIVQKRSEEIKADGEDLGRLDSRGYFKNKDVKKQVSGEYDKRVDALGDKVDAKYNALNEKFKNLGNAVDGTGTSPHDGKIDAKEAEAFHNNEIYTTAYNKAIADGKSEVDIEAAGERTKQPNGAVPQNAQNNIRPKLESTAEPSAADYAKEKTKQLTKNDPVTSKLLEEGNKDIEALNRLNQKGYFTPETQAELQKTLDGKKAEIEKDTMNRYKDVDGRLKGLAKAADVNGDNKIQPDEAKKIDENPVLKDIKEKLKSKGVNPPEETNAKPFDGASAAVSGTAPPARTGVPIVSGP